MFFSGFIQEKPLIIKMYHYLILGIVTGLYARYFVIISQKVEHFIKGLQLSKMRKAMFGGPYFLLCVLFPPLFGEGYDTVKLLLTEIPIPLLKTVFSDILKLETGRLSYFSACFVLKAFATSFTIFSGGNGGNFAPSSLQAEL
jgi:CIC family chloride channel protein